MSADRMTSLLTLAVLVADAVLLAGIELMFLTLGLGAVPIPLSALVAALTTPWLVRRAGELSEGLLGAGVPLLAWTLTIGVLGLVGPGGDVLLPDGWPSLLLVAAGLFPGALVLGRVIKERRAGLGHE